MEKFTGKNKKPNPINIASKYSSEFFIELFNENLTSEISLAKIFPVNFSGIICLCCTICTFVPVEM